MATFIGTGKRRDRLQRGVGLPGLCTVLALCCGHAPAVSALSSNALLSVDQNRAAIVARVIADRGKALLQAGAGIAPGDLREMLMQLRADQLLAASMAGSLDGLRDVVARSLVGGGEINPALIQTVSTKAGGTLAKALGDATDDVVYTPVTPCRLVDTRGIYHAVYQGDGTAAHKEDAFSPGEIRTYTVKGGNSVCLGQLPDGLGPAAVQLQVFGIPTTAASGDIEILPQGSTFGSTATEVFVSTVPFNTVSTTAKINTANDQISVQVRGGAADLAVDVVGYFKVPGNYGAGTSVMGVYSSVGGGVDQTASPGAYAGTIGGGDTNTVTAEWSTIGGGYKNTADGAFATIGGGANNGVQGDFGAVIGGAANQVAGTYGVALGGRNNLASGSTSIAAGSYAEADQRSCAVFELWGSSTPMNCGGLSEVFRIGATHGLSVDYYSELNSGFGARWVAMGDFFPNTTIGTWTGAYLSDGGTWTNNSDRNSKVQLEAVDSGAVLEKVAALPISTWRYKVEKDQVHMGPMAQDFHAAFGLGADEKHIATIDEDGVALAAIQGMYRELLSDKATLESQRRQIEELKQEMSRMRAIVLEPRERMVPAFVWTESLRR